MCSGKVLLFSCHSLLKSSNHWTGDRDRKWRLVGESPVTKADATISGWTSANACPLAESQKTVPSSAKTTSNAFTTPRRCVCFFSPYLTFPWISYLLKLRLLIGPSRFDFVARHFLSLDCCETLALVVGSILLLCEDEIRRGLFLHSRFLRLKPSTSTFRRLNTRPPTL